MDVRAWLEGQGLGQHAEVFASNDIDAEMLRDLTADDLKELGVASLGQRKKLLGAIAALDSAEAEAEASPAPAPEVYTPKYLAERIRDARALMIGERKHVTVLFADIKGSLELIEGSDPEEASRILDGATRVMMDAVHRYEGTVNKVMGDGIMALFGAPIAHEDHAARACYAALAIQRTMAAHAEQVRRAHGTELAARVGLHSGEVMVRAIGNDLSLDYDAIGPTVHLASRMEQVARPGAIRLTEATVRLADGLIEVEPLGAIPIKGMPEPVTAFDLTGVGVARTRLQASAARGLTPFVGRTVELEALHRARERAESGHGQLVTVVGEPGVGKSRLLYELTHALPMRPWLVLEARSVSSGQASAWAPVIDLLKQYFGIAADEDRRGAAEKVLGKLLMLDDALSPVVLAVLALLELPNDDPHWQSLNPSQWRRRQLDGVKGLLVRESQVQPVALVLEDMHWVDAETQALVDELVESLPACRILLLANYRPEYQHGWGGRTYCTQLRIDPLGEETAEALLTALLGDAPELTDVRHRLMERSEGNPLFLEESVRSLVERGLLAGERGWYRLSGPIEAIDIPISVITIIAARIDRLSAEEKTVLQTAAVIGEDIPLALLEAVVDLQADDLHGAAARLRSREFLHETRLFPEIAYAFRHGLVRQVAYDSLLHQTRRARHTRIGEALEAQHAGNLDEVAETLAHHFEQGAVWPKAIEYLLSAARKARRRYTYPMAAEFCEKACRIAEREAGLESLHARALEALGDVHSLLGDLEPANANYEAAIALAAESGWRTRIDNKRHRAGVALRDGARIAYYVHGSGDPTLVFMSPIGYGLVPWQPLIERLCQEFRVITIDPRGTGRSDPVVRPFLTREHGLDVAAVVRHLAYGPVVGIGLSRGGVMMSNAAASEPSLFQKLVLVGTPARLPEPGHPLFEQIREERGFVERAEGERALRLFASRTISEPGTENLQEQRFLAASRLPEETIRHFYDRRPPSDFEHIPLLNQLRIPILIMHGTADQRVPFDDGRLLAESVQTAEFYAFEGRGHVFTLTATDEFCDVLRQFVRNGTVAPPP